jgi:hypothetical protein
MLISSFLDLKVRWCLHTPEKGCGGSQMDLPASQRSVEDGKLMGRRQGDEEQGQSMWYRG